MKKKFVTFITAIFMVVTLAACGGDTGVSEETYTTLKENWMSLAEFYNQVSTDYNTAYNNGEIERDADFEKLMNEIADALQEMNNTAKDDLTEEKAVEMNNTLIRLQKEMADAVGAELIE